MPLVDDLVATLLTGQPGRFNPYVEVCQHSINGDVPEAKVASPTPCAKTDDTPGSTRPYPADSAGSLPKSVAQNRALT